MHFEGRLASGPDNICNLFVDFIQRTYVDDVFGALLIPDHISCRMTHLLVLSSSLQRCKGAGWWHPPYVTPIFKKGRHNNVENYCGVAILSAIPKRFELLVYRTMYDNLRNLISVNQQGFVKNRSTVTNFSFVRFFCAEFN
jgi:hypothetical protein